MEKNNFSKVIIILLIGFFFSVNFCFAQSFFVAIDKKVYSANEQAKIYINISDKSLADNIRGSVLFPSGAIQPIYDLSNVIKNSQSDKVEIIFDIYDTMPEGKYEVKIMLLENEEVKEESVVSFMIQGTKKMITAEIKLCEDEVCGSPKKVFVKDKIVFIKIFSSVFDLKIEGTIKSESKADTLNFNKDIARIIPDTVGSYELNLKLSKSGYGDLNIKEYFAVIAAPAQIKSVFVCNVDGKCVFPENAQNCPQDCIQAPINSNSVSKIFKTTGNAKVIVSALIVVIIIAVILVYLFLIKQKEY